MASKRLEVIDPRSGAVDFKTITLHVRRAEIGHIGHASFEQA
jgi:hypothetical protein